MLLHHRKKTVRQKGFTLIELLVVIAILVILFAVIVGIFTGVLKNNRDQKRLRDLNTIKQALELYRYDQGAYPLDWDLSSLTPTPLVGVGTTTTYLSSESFPKDPDSGKTYIYKPSATGDTYLLCAKQEGIQALDSADSTDCASENCGREVSENCNAVLSSP